MNRSQRLTPVPAAFREVNVTPVSWHLPNPGTEAAYFVILRECFGDAVEVTIGQARVSVKLQVFAEVSAENVAERAKAAQRRLFAQWQQDSREEALDGDELEAFREGFLKRQGIEGTT